MSSAPEASTAVDFIVSKEDLSQCRFVAAAEPEEIELEPGQVLVRVVKFALTANNISYAVTGDALSYWEFFPAEEGWGRVPVWGFGDVVRSRHDEVAEGERLFGYFPMSTHLVMQPERVNRGSLIDATPHRKKLPAVYNRYTRVANDPGYLPEYEDEQMLLWPLFMTSFLLDDFLAENDFFGARAVLLTSASSKTAIGLAFLLSRNRSAECDVVGLTSPGNLSFVESLGCYDRVVPYEKIQSLPNDVPVVSVDMAGNGEVLSTLHHHFGHELRHSCLVGATHWDRGEREQELPGADPTFFFAPTQIQKRTKDWGPQGLQERFAQAWRQFLESTDDWIRLVRGSGQAAVEQVYRDTLAGRAKPDEGYLLSL